MSCLLTVPFIDTGCEQTKAYKNKYYFAASDIHINEDGTIRLKRKYGKFKRQPIHIERC